MRKISAMIEWRSGLDGPSGLILLLCLMVLNQIKWLRYRGLQLVMILNLLPIRVVKQR